MMADMVWKSRTASSSNRKQSSSGVITSCTVLLLYFNAPDMIPTSSCSKSLYSFCNFNISISCCLLYTFPSSFPRMQSSNLLTGKESGNVITMNNLVSHIVYAPTAKPYLEQILCGTISPIRTIAIVEPITATIPPVKPSSNIVNEALTKVFPRSNVQSKKLPWRRTGMIFLAYFFWREVPLLSTIFNSLGSSDISPRFSPENNPDNIMRIPINNICSHNGKEKLFFSSLILRYFFFPWWSHLLELWPVFTQT